jgi:uncharacterized protein (TIGR02598 family)
MDKPSAFSTRPKSVAAFSLVEVALAIGIIAFAFIALFALIPTGLTTFRAAIDNSNETWIMQGINSMVETTNFSGIKDLGFKNSGEVYYYDEEGRFTDSHNVASTDDKVKQTRLYQVKLVVDSMYRPDGDSQPPEGGGASPRLMSHGWRVIVVMAPLQDKTTQTQFDSVIDATTLQALDKNTKVHNRTFFVARMDSQIIKTP